MWLQIGATSKIVMEVLSQKKPDVILYILLGGKFWEIISYIILLVFYIRIKLKFVKVDLIIFGLCMQCNAAMCNIDSDK